MGRIRLLIADALVSLARYVAPPEAKPARIVDMHLSADTSGFDKELAAIAERLKVRGR